MMYIFNDVDSTNTPVEAYADGDMGVNFSFFTSNDAKVKTKDEDPSKKKRASKPKNVVTGEIVTANSGEMINPIPGANVAEVNYADTYKEANNLIRATIIQADELSSEIKQDIDTVRSSKTLKNKYTYITNLTTTAGSLLSTKIAAIKELSNSVTQSHNLELNRLKALKLNENKETDEMKMMDIYSAFVNTPMGTYTPAAPNIQDITLGVNNPNGNVSGVEMVVPVQNKPLTPEQNRMRMEANPNIQVVVRYDAASGQRSFDVVDKNSGMSVPNYPRPDNFLLEDTTIDVHAGIARNRNINTVWPLIVNGRETFVNEY